LNNVCITQKIRPVIDLGLGLLILISLILGYGKTPSHLTEYCFVSGLLSGILFLASFIRYTIVKKFFSSVYYFCSMISLLLIFIATLVIGLNLEGAFWFIHIINPLLVFTYWLVFCDHSTIKHKSIMTAVILPFCWILFAFILWKAGFKCPFPASLIFIGNPWYVSWLVILALSICIEILSFLLHILHKFLHTYIQKRRKNALSKN
jgi:hypothetical protein